MAFDLFLRLRRDAVLALALSVTLTPSVAAAQDEPAWILDWDTASARAAREMRPILLDYTADWCAPCRRMDSDFWPRPEVRAITERFVRVRVDYDGQGWLRNRFDVESIPNVVVLDPWGNLLGRLVGWSGNPVKHLRLLRDVPADYTSVADAARAVSARRADGFAYERLAEFYFPSALAGASRDFFEKAEGSRELKADPPRRTAAWAKLGWCELKLDDPKPARKWFDKALDPKTGSARSDQALAGLAVTWARLKKLDRAYTLLEELRTRHPDSTLLPIAAEQVEKAKAATAR